MVGSFSIPAVSYFRCLPLPSGGQVSRSASAPRKRGCTDLRLTLSWDRTWVEGARRHQDLARPRGVEHLSSSVSTELTLAVPPSRCPAEIVGIPRFFLGLWHRSGVNVSLVDTDAPPGRCQRLLSSVGRDLEGSDPPCDPCCQVLDRPDPGRGARPRAGPAGTPPSGPAYLVGVRPRVR